MNAEEWDKDGRRKRLLGRRKEAGNRAGGTERVIGKVRTKGRVRVDTGEKES